MKIPLIDMQATGENIKRLRKQKGIPVSVIQEVMGLTNPQAIYKWQSGKSMPTIDNLVILSAMLDTPIDEIIERK